MINLTRLRVIQFLYSLFYNNESFEQEKIDLFLKNHDFSKDPDNIIYKNKKIDKNLFLTLAKGTIEKRSNLDDIIKSFLEKSKNLDLLLFTILRVGVYEVLYNQNEKINNAIIISEYTKITDMFYNNKISKMVNAVLDNVSKN